MKKTRKILSLVLALAFIFSMAVPAMAEAPSAQEVAGSRLLSLSVIDGYPGGGLGLDKTITRAEVAVVLAKISGMGSAADLLKDTPSKFSDVKPNEWYTGWVNLASAQGWVKGDPQGTFRPNDPVQYREMVTMLLKALGYNDNLPGDWPTNYLAKAASLSITKGIVSDAKAHAVRGDVFIMTSRTLDKDTVSYDKDNDRFVASGKSLLEDKMEFAKVEGVVTDIPRTSSLKDNQIRIDGKVYKVVGTVDNEEIFGTKVNAWLNDDDEVVFVDITSDSVLYDAVEWNSSKEQLKLVDADAKYDLAKGVKVFINGGSAKVSDLGASYSYAKVVLDKDGDVSFIDAYTFSNFLVVEEVNGNYIYGYGDEINAKDYTIVKEGKTIALADAAKGDILFYNSSAEFAEVFNKSVEGEIKRIYDDRISVEGKDYKRYSAKYLNENDKIKPINSDALLKDIAEAMQDAGKVAVFLNRAGDMVFLSGDIGTLKTSSSYVFVTADSNSFNDRGTSKWTFDILNAQGAEVKYDVKNADVIGPSKKLLKSATGVVIPWDTGDALVATSDVITKNIVTELKLDSDAKIDEIKLVAPNNVPGPKAQIKTSEKYFSGKKIDQEAVVFLIEDFVKANGKVKDIVVKAYKDLDFDYINKGVFYEKDDKIVAIVVEASSRKDDAANHFTVATADDVKIAGKTQYTLKLVINGEKVTVDTKVDISSYPGVNKGDLLEVAIDKKTGNVNTVTKLNGTAQEVPAGAVAELNTADKSLKIGSTSGFKLGVDGVVVDATDSYKVISLSSLKNGDTVKALRVTGTSNYLDVIVRTAKAGSTPVVEVPTDGTVTYIDLFAFTPYVIIGDKEIDIIGSAAEFFTNGAVTVGKDIAYELTPSGKMFKITAISGNVTLDAADNYSTFDGLTVDGNLTISTTGAAGPPATYGTVTASNVTVKGNLTVDANATLNATHFTVEGNTTVNGTATFNSNLKGDVTVAGTATFKNVTIGGDLDVTAGTATFDGSVKVTGDITGASNITAAGTADAATATLVADAKALATAQGIVNNVVFTAPASAGKVKLNNTAATLEYSLNGAAYTDCSATATEIAANIGDKIVVRVKATPAATKELVVAASNIGQVTMSGATFATIKADAKIKGLVTDVVYEVRKTEANGTVGDWVTYTAVASEITLTSGNAVDDEIYEIRIKATDKQPASTIQSSGKIA